jgi:hypothetical protein
MKKDTVLEHIPPTCHNHLPFNYKYTINILEDGQMDDLCFEVHRYNSSKVKRKRGWKPISKILKPLEISQNGEQ